MNLLARFILAAALLGGCNPDAPVGTLGGPCRPDGTCDGRLRCVEYGLGGRYGCTLPRDP